MKKHKNTREHATGILVQVLYMERKAAPLLEHALPHLPDERDHRLLRELVHGTIEHHRLLDAALARFLRKPPQRLPKRVHAAMLLGAHQILNLDRIPSRAAVNESVKIVKSHNPKAAGLMNAVLRRLADAVEQSGKDGFIASLLEKHASEVERLALQYSQSDFFVSELLEAYGPGKARSVLTACNEHPAITLRANLARTTRDELATALAKAGVATEPGGTPESLHLLAPADITTLPGFTEGMFFVQDETTQRVTRALDPKSGENILDCCAAPGGKTTHIFELTGEKAAITAVEVSAKRMGELEKNLFRMGAETIRAIIADAHDFCTANAGAFDKVLVDAPCSNSGVLRRRPEARLRIKPDTVRSLADKALSLLDAAANAVRLGGKLLYSTCSILPRENSKVTALFLERHAGFSLEREETFLPEPGGPDGGYFALLARTTQLA